MLGSASEADDAVQDAWLRVSRAGTEDVEDLRAWLTTVVARVCLNMLRGRRRRPGSSPAGPADGSAARSRRRATRPGGAGSSRHSSLRPGPVTSWR
ncbi:sigma factor [Georgenia sp. EYE_87]|uniref:sigma factor n=1 Tax=Georgenia sp. EYE_87 TaxID=2853448 RepID=UPI0020054C5D|nr:sigma factor [Georgenia sp. EYE_87]